MNTTNIIVLSVVIIILLCITMFVTEIFIPINRKFEMNSICRNYMYLIENQGELSNEAVLELHNLLLKVGLSEINISVHAEGSKFGDKILFSVNAQSEHDSLSQLFTRTTERINMTYERKLTIKKIVN